MEHVPHLPPRLPSTVYLRVCNTNLCPQKASYKIGQNCIEPKRPNTGPMLLNTNKPIFWLMIRGKKLKQRDRHNWHLLDWKGTITASGYFYTFLILSLPTILRLQIAVKLIMSTVPTNGFGSNEALGMSSFTIRHDMSERQEESLGANLLTPR